MRVRKVDATVERQLLIGMIVSDEFLKRILPVFEYDYLDTGPAKRVAEWVIDYFDRYNKAPQAMIQDIFKERASGLDESVVEWIQEFLSSISSEYEKQGFNKDYLFDQSIKYFKRQRLWKASRRVQELLDKGRLEQAEEVWLSSMRLPEADDLGIDPFDPATIKRLYTVDRERVSMTLGIEGIDRMVGPMRSGWLVVFLGPMKRGKTFALLHVATRAVLKEWNIVFISLEMEEFDVAVRAWMSVGSLRSDGEAGVLKFPYFIDRDLGTVGYEEVERPGLSMDTALSTADVVRQVSTANVRFKSFPMGTAGLKEIRQYLDVLEVYDNFSPYVIVVDYIGAMKAPKGVADEYNYNSAGLKALAQERKASVFTGHQGTRATLEKLSMGPSDTSQDIRILANVDCMFGLNQTEAEMDEGIMRINVIAHRHRRFTRRKQAIVLQQLSVGQFVLDSAMIDLSLIHICRCQRYAVCRSR